LRLTPEHAAVVLEIGTNQPGEIATLAKLAAPTIGVVTTVAAVHTEFLGSVDGVREEKAALVRAVGAEGTVVLNADDPRVAGMAADTPARVITYGRHARADVRATGDIADADGMLTFTLEAGGGRQPVRLAFSGRHNVTNALAAAGVGIALGWRLDEIVGGLETARPVAGRCVWRTAGDVRVLDDTYNANPVSMRAALETVVAARQGHRVVAVLGDMLELGALVDEAHEEIGRAAATLGVDELVGVGRHIRLAVEAARAGGLTQTYHATTFEDTVAHLLKRLSPGDVVLVKGSRGMRMERVVDALVARLVRADDHEGRRRPSTE
jgi:UDP-N-acetylmuramoyl-tripeptide--D-alanyl-D-alanine ligase